ncbi:MAG: hypothetical protein ABJZ55_23225 [Fuerstiella sp.]
MRNVGTVTTGISENPFSNNVKSRPISSTGRFGQIVANSVNSDRDHFRKRVLAKNQAVVQESGAAGKLGGKRLPIEMAEPICFTCPVRLVVLAAPVIEQRSWGERRCSQQRQRGDVFWHAFTVEF